MLLYIHSNSSTLYCCEVVLEKSDVQHMQKTPGLVSFKAQEIEGGQYPGFGQIQSTKGLCIEGFSPNDLSWRDVLWVLVYK